MPPYSSDKLLSKRRHQESIKQEAVRAKSRVKCVLVGDGAVGKTSLVVSYTTNGFPTEYIPTAYDNYNVIVSVDGQPLRLQLCDTAGQDDFDSLRPLCYAGTDVFVICFSVVSPASLHNAAAKWVPEVKAHCPEASILLVGTQSDLRADVGVLVRLARYGERPVNEVEARRLVAQSGANGYVECSALTQHNLKEVFDQAIMCSLRNQARRHPPHPRPPCRPPLRPPTTKHKSSVWRKLCCCVAS